MQAMLDPLDLVNLPPLMERSRERPDVTFALVDRPLRRAAAILRSGPCGRSPGGPTRSCARRGSVACWRGTVVAGILSTERGRRRRVSAQYAKVVN
jgi:hypothetical protein